MSELKILQPKVQEALRPYIDESYQAKMQTIVPTDWEIMGVRIPQIRKIVKTLIQQHPHVTLDDVLELVDRGFLERVREVALSGIFWLATMKRELDRALWPLIGRWVEQLADWEMCDQLAMGVAAVIVDKEPTLVNDLVHWARSSSPWRRRFTVAVASALNQKGRARVSETLRICHELMQEETAIVRKGVGWALREASKMDELAVYSFLLRWRDQAHKTILREGAQKLTAAHRATLLEG